MAYHIFYAHWVGLAQRHLLTFTNEHFPGQRPELVCSASCLMDNGEGGSEIPCEILRSQVKA